MASTSLRGSSNDNLTAEEHLFAKIRASNDLSSFNIPRGEEFIVSRAGQHKIHVRTSWPGVQPPAKPRAVVLFIHGYASHCNRPTHLYFAEQYAAHDIAYVSYDSLGHGYSEGTRALVDNKDDPVDDAIDVIRAIYGLHPSQTISATERGLDKPDKADKPHSGIPASPAQSTQTSSYDSHVKHVFPSSLPLFIAGHSMGGACAVLTATRLLKCNDQVVQSRNIQSQGQQPSAVNHSDALIPLQGLMLLCPAIDVTRPPAVVTAALNYIIVPLFPLTSIPSFASSMVDDYVTWVSDDYIRYIKHDQYPANMNGLSFGDGMRFKTAASILDMANAAQACVPQLSCHVLALHDSSDKVVRVEGSHYVVRHAGTAAEHKQQQQQQVKEFVEVEGGRHDITANRMQFIAEQSINWVLQRLQA